MCMIFAPIGNVTGPWEPSSLTLALQNYFNKCKGNPSFFSGVVALLGDLKISEKHFVGTDVCRKILEIRRIRF